jgi:hypothetical protein
MTRKEILDKVAETVSETLSSELGELDESTSFDDYDADSLDRLEVLVTAVLVRDPLAVAAVVVEVQHGGDRVDADAVYMVLVQPEHRGGYQEGDYLISGVVKYIGAPFLVLSLARVLIFVAAGAVKFIQPVRVLREMRGYPVKDDTDVILVALINEVH